MSQQLTYRAIGLAIGALVMASQSHAQPIEPQPVEPAQTIEPIAADTTDASEQAAEAIAREVNPDELADDLNSRQQLQQTFTLKRTVNGETETAKRTIVYTDDIPVRASEARQSVREQLRQSFDRELLTRVEAFEEAKIDFTLADSNNDGAMTKEEFAILVQTWNDNAERHASAPNDDIEKQREYDAFLREITDDDTPLTSQKNARQKFQFMAGAAATITRADYIREYLLDFDAMDADKDTVLKDQELERFRSISRGEDF